VPALHQKTREWVRQGKLAVLGIAQEQHPDRCRLFAQWRQLEWPIVYDPINVLGLRGVPVLVAVDEHGIVRSLRPDMDKLEAEFLDKTFAPDEATPPAEPRKATPPDLGALRRRAETGGSADAWRELGDGLAIWGGTERIDAAIEPYSRAIRLEPKDAEAHFRLGTCYRIRYESPRAVPGDFQTAVDHWSAARAIDPNVYIWRRRIEQYGPRLNKPYPFYDWVETAVAEIRARGEQPVVLGVLPTGGERARPAADFAVDSRDEQPPDADGRIHRDTLSLILADVTVVPPRVKPGGSVRAYVTLRPNVERKAHWNNEGEPLRLWVDGPPGWQVEPRLLSASQGEKPETSEPRRLEFEARAAEDARGPTKLEAYALYYVCEDVEATCRYLRQDIPVVVEVGR
jgi:hypothetical protein